MNTSEPNNPRNEQEEQLRKSPMKQPTTETAHADAADVGKAADQGSGAGPAGGGDNTGVGAPYGHETVHPDQHAMLPEEVHPHGIDIDNDDASDDTVDTDGKDRDAKRAGGPPGGQVLNNASIDNAEPTPAEGLAGIDSRPGGNRPAVYAADGSEATYQGVVDDTRLNMTAGVSSDAEEAVKFDEHVPPNHARAGHHIKITPKG